MGFYRERDYDDDSQLFSDSHDDNVEELSHRKKIRRMLEDRLERKRLKEELDDFDGELDADFDWDHVER